MAMTDISIAEAKAQIVDLQKKLATMRKNRADYFTRKNELHDSIVAARVVISEAKHTGRADVVASNRENVELLLKQFGDMTQAPPAEGSSQYNALLARIAELEAQIAVDAAQAPYGADVAFESVRVIAEARAIRQAAAGATLAAQSATEKRLAAEAAANRAALLDGST